MQLKDRPEKIPMSLVQMIKGKGESPFCVWFKIRQGKHESPTVISLLILKGIRKQFSWYSPKVINYFPSPTNSLNIIGEKNRWKGDFGAQSFPLHPTNFLNQKRSN